MRPTASSPGSVHSAASQARVRRVRIAIAVILVGCGAYSMQRFVRKAHKGRTTLMRWLPYAEEFGQDDQLYDRHPDYLYPTFFLTIMRPLTWVPPMVAAVIWQLSKFACVIGLFAMAWDMLSRDGPLPFWVKLGSVLMSARFLDNDLSHGNVNVFICFLTILAVWLLARGWPVACGFVVAVAACIKVTPALWAVYLLYKRQWRAAIASVVGAAFCLGVVPLVIVSPQLNVKLMRSWHAHVVDPFVSEADVWSTRINQSMTGVTNRLLSAKQWAENEPSVAIVDMDLDLLHTLQRGLAVVTLLVLGWACRGRLPRGEPLAIAVEWSLVGAVTLILSGYTWTGHFCLLTLGHVAVLTFLDRAEAGWRTRILWGLTGVSFALCTLTSDFMTEAGRQWAAAVGLMFFGLLALIAALLIVRSRLRTA